MKKLAYIILAMAVLAAGLSACQQKVDPVPEDSVELRYRVANSYELDALNAKPFNIVVKSTKPWTIRSYHPDWCIISEEEGEAQPDSLVHVGKGENTTVKVQYYDNVYLDDRVDTLEIASAGYIGKRVTVYQKGIAYLRVPEADIEGGLEIAKAGGELNVNVLTNQKWSVKVLPYEGQTKVDWATVSAGATGELDGTATVTVQENTGEKRYCYIGVYDRHGEERAMIKVTQDGVQLDPETFEVRVGFDQTAATLNVVANAKWTAEKGGTEDWFSIDNPDGHDGDDVLRLTFKENAGDALRKSTVVLKTVAANPGDAVATKEIVIKQAFPIAPVRHEMTSDEMGAWSSDWANPPVYTKDYGTTFTAKARLNQGGMPFGTYTFRWKDWQGGARIRHWFCFSDGIELKMDIRPIDAKISYDFNASGSGKSGKPSISAYTDVDWSQPIEVTYKFDPSGAEFCHITYLVNGKEAGSFDTSADILHTVTWGSKINMYVGCDQVSGQDPGSAVLEWYEYTAPMMWDEE